MPCDNKIPNLLELNEDPWLLEFVPGEAITQEMCNVAVKEDPWLLEYVPDHLKTREMCVVAVKEDPWLIQYIPDCFKTREMCNKAIEEDLWLLKFIPKIFLELSTPIPEQTGITIIAKNYDRADYPFISICGETRYREHKARALIIKHPKSTLFTDYEASNSIVTYNYLRENGLILVDPENPRHFRLNITPEKLKFLLRPKHFCR